MRRSKAVIIVALRAFKWTLRGTLNIPATVCLSNTHVSRSKVSSEYSSAQADKIIIIIINNFSAISMFKEWKNEDCQ
jgi:hypothetical protein